MGDFAALIREIEEEAREEGPEAEAELEAFRAHYRLARKVLELRKARNLTQTELAELSGIGQSEISRIEGGRANPTLSTLTALARSLGVEVDLIVPEKQAA